MWQWTSQLLRVKHKSKHGKPGQHVVCFIKNSRWTHTPLSLILSGQVAANHISGNCYFDSAFSQEPLGGMFRMLKYQGLCCRLSLPITFMVVNKVIKIFKWYLMNREMFYRIIFVPLSSLTLLLLKIFNDKTAWWWYLVVILKAWC